MYRHKLRSICRPDWNTAKVVMSDVNFLKKLEDYDKEHIPEAIIKKIKSYVDHKDFQPAVSGNGITCLKLA